MRKSKKIIKLVFLFMILILPFISVYADEEVAETVFTTCEDVKHLTWIYTALRIIAPFLLILFGGIDFLKAVTAGDVKKQQEARSKFPKRLIALLLFIVLPFVVSFLVTTFGSRGAENTSVFCCIVTNGNSECEFNSSNSNSSASGTSSNPNNSDYVDENADNMPGGSNYISPVTRVVTAPINACVNQYYGECKSINISKNTCSCTYTSRENLSSEELCDNDPFHIGKSVRREGSGGSVHVSCYYNAVLNATGQKISNINSLSTTPTYKDKVNGGNNNYDAYYNYERQYIENTTLEDCNSRENSTAACKNGSYNCICIYGKSLPIDSTAYNHQEETDQRRVSSQKKARYNELADILNNAKYDAFNSEYVVQFKEWYPGYWPVADSMLEVIHAFNDHYNANSGTSQNTLSNFNSICDDKGVSGSAREWLLNYFSSFIVNFNSYFQSYENIDSGDMNTLVNYIDSITNIYKNNKQIFMDNIAEFNELCDYFHKTHASISDFNTDKVYEKIN